MMESVFTSILLKIPTVLIHGLGRKAQLEPGFMLSFINQTHFINLILLPLLISTLLLLPPSLLLLAYLLGLASLLLLVPLMICLRP